MPASLIVRAKDAQGNSDHDGHQPGLFLMDVAEHTQGPAPSKEAPLAGAIKGEPNSLIPTLAPKP